MKSFVSFFHRIVFSAPTIPPPAPLIQKRKARQLQQREEAERKALKQGRSARDARNAGRDTDVIGDAVPRPRNYLQVTEWRLID